MRGHPEILADFAAALAGGDVPTGLTAPDPAELPRRLAIYRNNRAVGMADALASRFPVIAALVGEEFFRAMARLYAETEGPQSPVMQEWGEGFADFLEGFPPLAAHPYMADVARIEFARGRSFHAADAPPADPARLAGADPQALCIALHPSVAMLRLQHPAVWIWARHQPGGQDLPAVRGPQVALILRDPGFQVHVEAIGPGDAALIEALQGGARLRTAAERAWLAQPDHDPQPLLVNLMRLGAIVEPEE